jgi:hypothetical protein
MEEQKKQNKLVDANMRHWFSNWHHANREIPKPEPTARPK